MPSKRGKVVSLETREKLVKAVHEQDLSVTEAARRLMVPPTTARTILKRYKATGRIEPERQGGNHRAVLNEEHLNWIAAELDEKADLRVSDIHSKIQQAFQFELPPSMSAINRAINDKLHYTLKVLKVEPADYNKPERIKARKEWCQSFFDSGASMLNAVYVDETGFNLHTHITYGRAKVGMRAIKKVASAKGQNISYIAAIGPEGLIADFAYQGSTNNELFAWFLKEKLFPKLQHRRRVIMDNASIHKTQLVRNTFHDSPHQQVFLPPYSPFLNAAEWHFAHIKPRMSKEEYKNATSLLQAIRNSANTVTPAHVMGWIREVNRNLLRAINGEVLGREYHYNMAEGDEDLAGQLLDDLANLHVLA